MTDHPITPPPELVEQWEVETACVAVKAARWGADQELEACCQHIRDYQWGFVVRPDGTKGMHRAVDLKLARRPKPPSLKEQALGAMGRFTTNAHTNGDEMMRDFDTIRRALEQLDDE
jgi:hypothetical protein